MNAGVDSITDEVQKELTIDSPDVAQGVDNASTTQPQRGGKKGKKKQKWKALDLSDLPSPPSQQSSNTSHGARNQWHNSQSGSSTVASDGARGQWGDSRQGKSPGGYGGSHSGRNQGYSPNQKYDKPQDYGYRERGSNVALSKALVTLLRHKKPHDIPIDGAGFASVERILAHSQFQRFYSSEKDINEIISNDNKDRFEIRGSVGNNFQIRATQGHSFKLDVEESGLEEIVDPKQFPTVVHGTYMENWRFIKKEGLRRMRRSYVHFAIGFIGETHVTSGMRNTCDIVIVLDLEKAMGDGLKFYASKNKVVLCEGDRTGLVSAKYFKVIKKYDYKMQQFKDIDFVFEG